MAWSKVKRGKKPLGWWYHKLLCEYYYHFGDGLTMYYYHLNKMVDKYKLNIYGKKCL